MSDQKTKAAMIALCSLHVLQGVYDDTQGTNLFNPSTKKLVEKLLRRFDPVFQLLLSAEKDLEEGQIQFNNLANLIECTAQWMVKGELEERMEKLAKLIEIELVVVD